MVYDSSAKVYDLTAIDKESVVADALRLQRKGSKGST
jgi:hypothetical protein